MRKEPTFIKIEGATWEVQSELLRKAAENNENIAIIEWGRFIFDAERCNRKRWQMIRTEGHLEIQNGRTVIVWANPGLRGKEFPVAWLPSGTEIEFGYENLT
ncbi:MAG TPA: hypothetical protein VEA59_01255 [Patescibacteria group bacterium]|nr:hypothetical protein [Patescibacteria group bacterium]